MSRRALEEAGHTDVTEAKHGEEALALMRETAFDLVISDLNMDPVDGMELLTAIRADASLAATPFILMTGKFEDDGVREAEKAGANNTVLKPFDATTVREKIEQVLSTKS